MVLDAHCYSKRESVFMSDDTTGYIPTVLSGIQKLHKMILKHPTLFKNEDANTVI